MDNNIENNTPAAIVARWSFSDKKDHSTNWYIAAGTILLFFVAWGIFNGLWVMSVALLLFAGVYVLVENNSSDTVEVALSEHGFFIDNDFFDFSQFGSFCIIYYRGVPYSLRLLFKNATIRRLELYGLNSIDVHELRRYLLQVLPEEEQHKELGIDDKIINQLKL